MTQRPVILTDIIAGQVSLEIEGFGMADKGALRDA